MLAMAMETVVRNHALVDGNKRLGWTAVVVFHDLNARTQLEEAWPIYSPSNRPRSSNSWARRNTPSSISSVSLPVAVFCCHT
jgi:hypothetical protein